MVSVPQIDFIMICFQFSSSSGLCIRAQKQTLNPKPCKLNLKGRPATAQSYSASGGTGGMDSVPFRVQGLGITCRIGLRICYAML